MKILLPIDVLHPYQPLLSDLQRFVPLTGADFKLLYVAESASKFEEFLSGTGKSAVEIDAQLKSRATKTLQDIADSLKQAGATTSIDVQQGAAAVVIERVGSEEKFDCIAIGAHHVESGDHLPLGSTASHVVKHGSGTILLLRPNKAKADFKKVLIALDGSDQSLIAMRNFVEQFKAADRKIDVYLVNVVSIVGLWKFVSPVEFIASVEDNLNMAGETILAGGEKILNEYGILPKEMFIRTGDIAVEIMKAADQLEVDAIIIGAQGRSAVEHLLLGSVSHKLSQHASSPLVIVK
jgi:nucleotide-binding universal stress UspA family protein